MDMCYASAVHLVQMEEGNSLKPYKDTEGVWTIGRGYNMTAHGIPPEQCQNTVWTQEQADKAFTDAIDQVVAALDDAWPKWRNLDEVRQAVCVSSVYQLGSAKAGKFLATIDAMEDHDWERAAAQIRASRWARQTPKRVNRNAEMLVSGKWPATVNGAPFDPDKGIDHGVKVADRSFGETVQPAPGKVFVQAAPEAVTAPPIVEAPAPVVQPPTLASFLSVVIPYLKAMASSKKALASVLGMVGLQVIGPDGLDWGLYHGKDMYSLAQLSPYISSALAAFIAWAHIDVKQSSNK